MVECLIDTDDFTFGGGKEESLATLCHEQGHLDHCREVINEKMKAITNSKKKPQAIGFPSLITKLYLAAELREIIDLAERVPLMMVLSWKTFNKPSQPTSGDTSSSRCPQVEEREAEEERDEEAHGDDESSNEEETDDDGLEKHPQIVEIDHQMGTIQTQQC